ncbi:MAG TPA: DAK2 domain-containing protein [Coriobacteriia bacterium]
MTSTDANESTSAISLITAAADALKGRRDEVNRLNVFPVPDGDTGTNMSLTMDSVMAEVAKLGVDASLEEICHAVTHSSLMGARGNSGVILSQILRGLCEPLVSAERIDAALISECLDRAVSVAFQAVRRPVEGTILTVLRDAADAARPVAEQEDADIATVLAAAVDEAYASVKRTPDLLPVLKEAGVVDAGGYGLAILMEGFADVLEGKGLRNFDVTVRSTGQMPEVGPENDWDDDEYLYCTEFLLFGQGLDREAIEDHMVSIGGSQLVVGSPEELKIHVHTDDPSQALGFALKLGEVAEVHIHNMRRQTEARSAELRAQAASTKPLGFVAVAAGSGLADILRSLGVDEIVSGGQTMNPSTAELLEAIERVPAQSVMVFPNNRNIILAANQTIGIAGKPVAVVPTTSVPQAFSALLAADPDVSLEENLAAMTQAADAVRTGEITTAIKDSKGKAGKIKAGQIIGIVDHEIEVIGSDIADVALRLLDLITEDGETVTLLGGADIDDVTLERIAADMSQAHPDLEIETHRGEQPLYPLIMAVE